MDVHSDMVEPVTPVPSYDNVSFWRTEDSGYHTFTPSSIECSELSTENIDPSRFKGSIHFNSGSYTKFYKNTPECKPKISYQFSFSQSTFKDSFPDEPSRRGTKRPYQEDTETQDVSFGSIPTPTSVIAGKIQKLKVNDSANFSGNYSFSSVDSSYTDTTNIYNFNAHTAFPLTPIKKICKSSCKLNKLKSNHKASPLRAINNVNYQSRKFARQLDFEIHSLSCEPQSLRVRKQQPTCPVRATPPIKPNQKIDIVTMLYKTVRCVPAINKIFTYLSNADIYNFSLVSPAWLEICEDVTAGREKLKRFIRNSKENQENKNSSTPKDIGDIVRRKLKEIHNIEHAQTVGGSRGSPPGSPRTVRFKTFSRSASLDTRIQLACVRCQQPAKVTEELSGESWAECMRSTCAYQFCKYCNCDRHPGKSCIRYDLDGPSPSKRKKKTCAAGSKQSKSNLRRLLIK